MSAPSGIGRCSMRRGEHIVDHDERARLLCAILPTASISTSSSTGLVGVSKNNARVLGRIAASQAERSRPSISVVCDAEARQQVLDDIAAAAEQGAGRHHVVAGLEKWQSSDAVTAAMPLAVPRAASAPSSAHMRFSNMATVGLA